MPSFISRDHYDAVLFDLDGVVTDSAGIQASCWKSVFDEFLSNRAARSAEPFRPFNIDTDYKLYLEETPRFEGVRAFLKSRSIILPEGTANDDPSRETICGLVNRQDQVLNQSLSSAGVQAYPGTVAFLKYLRWIRIKTSVVTSSHNCRNILKAAKVEKFFDACVDEYLLLEQGLPGKPAPDSLLRASAMLGALPARTVVIEASIAGIRAALRGGFGLVIGVERARSATELKAQGAQRVISDLVELLN